MKPNIIMFSLFCLERGISELARSAQNTEKWLIFRIKMLPPKKSAEKLDLMSK